MFCKKCGTKVKKEYVFCPICGSIVKLKLKGKPGKETDDLAEAVNQLKAGNDEGFSWIYFRTYKDVYNRAKYILNDEHEAMDLTQDVYVTLYKSIQKIKDGNALYGWLKTVVLRQGLRFIQKKKKADLLPDDSEYMMEVVADEHVDIEKSYMKSEDFRTIKRCISQLSDEQRLVVLAYYYDNMSIKEIADIMEISEGTVKSRLYLARKHLMNMLKAEEEKQGYKFFGAGLPFITPALDKTLKANVKIDKKIVLENYKKICSWTEIKETPALLKTVGITEKVAAMIAGAGFKKIVISVASFIAVGTACGIFLIAGGSAADDNTAAEKAGKEVVLTKVQEQDAAQSADNNPIASENGNAEVSNTTSENERTGSESIKIPAVGGLSYNRDANSADLNLSWSPVDGADGYEVYVATSESPTYKKYSTVNTPKCAVVEDNAYYRIKVRAFSNKNGKKVYGEFCSEISTEMEPVFPQKINVSSVWQDGEYVVVNVKPFTVNYLAEVELYRSMAADGDYERVGRVRCNPSRAVTVSQIYDIWPNEDQATYYYKVRIKAFKTWAGKPDKYSSYSNVISYKYDLDGIPDDWEEGEY